ncbi:hypothetical protein [Streptomyces sp. Inha503]|uniref:hypothetical protein n=1 Tax=Streptomyces sp. Inha503 TaxID=3383314 RepID=UPI00399FBABC
MIFETDGGEHEFINKPLGAEVYVEALTTQAVILHRLRQNGPILPGRDISEITSMPRASRNPEYRA